MKWRMAILPAKYLMVHKLHKRYLLFLFAAFFEAWIEALNSEESGGYLNYSQI